jgi:cardiolipin synthase
VLDTLLSILGVLLHVAAVATILMSQRREPTATLAWLLSVVLLPFLGLVAYLVFGRTRFRRVVKRCVAAETRLAGILERFDVHRKAGGTDAAELEPRTQGVLALGDRMTRTPSSSGNRVDVLVNASASYRSMIQAISGAREHVHVEFYIIQPDATGIGLRDQLVRKAREGLSVRLLYDALGSKKLPRDFWEPLHAAGGETAPFSPIWRILAPFRRRDRVDFRNHRKIVVVDGRVGFTGGINIGKEYLGLDPEMGHWRDTHMRIEGPAVLSLQRAFAYDWTTATQRVLDEERYYPEPEVAGPSTVQVIDSGPDSSWSAIAHVFVQTITSARRRVWITNPYFVPSPAIEQALVGAALRGVDVRLLLPGRPDHLLVAFAARSYYAPMLEAGARIYHYQRGFVHAKTMVIDDWVGTVGSANMDMRSFNLNFELNAFVYDAVFVNELADLFDRDLRHAREYTLEDERSLSTPARFLRSVARLLSPLL